VLVGVSSPLLSIVRGLLDIALSGIKAKLLLSSPLCGQAQPRRLRARGTSSVFPSPHAHRTALAPRARAAALPAQVTRSSCPSSHHSDAMWTSRCISNSLSLSSSCLACWRSVMNTYHFSVPNALACCTREPPGGNSNWGMLMRSIHAINGRYSAASESCRCI
jgi:hypothetical protein